MNIDINEIKENLHGKKVSIIMTDSSDVVLERAVILPSNDKDSFSIFNDTAMFRGNRGGDVIRINFKDIEDIEKLEDDGLAYHIRCKRNGWYIVSVLGKAS